jgi:hypothetical protein
MAVPRILEAVGIEVCKALNVDVADYAALITVPGGGVTERKRGRLVYVRPLPEDWDRGEAVTAVRLRRTRQ